MSTLPELPLELLNGIVGYALKVHPRPHEVLAVHSAFYDIGSAILYKHLQFRTVRQLLQFSQDESSIPYLPQSIELTLSGGTDDFRVFQYLANAIDRCRKGVAMRRINDSRSHSTYATALEVLELDQMSLCLNSHSSNPRLYQIYMALTRVKCVEIIHSTPSALDDRHFHSPKRFSWIGPDPSHHFSIAVSSICNYSFFPVVTYN